jgi:TrmH family RNA methyltransferase
MLSKAKIKLIHSLRLSKFRKQNGLFVAEGTTNVLDFLNSGTKPESLFATESWISGHKQHTDISAFSSIDEKEMKQISNLKNPSEVLGVFQIPETRIPDLSTFNDFILMLEDIRDPGNLGTMIRTADWFGFRQVICSTESVDAFNPKVVQASMGSLARVNIHYHNLEDLIESKPEELLVFGAVLNGMDITKLAKPDKGILLIGNEAHGISSSLMQKINQRVTIPNIPFQGGNSAESLNASIATAILCYEFRCG